MAIISMYGPRSISLLFNDNQDTDYESRKIDIYVIGPIFTHKNTKGSMEQ